MKTVNSLFTFHNVSINSKDSSHDLIMKYVFTFHNVSINSDICFYRLHTNIFAFTFHNVSINSDSEQEVWDGNRKFTFHNVSINSSRRTDKRVLRDTHLHSIMYLLIRAIGSKLETDGK